MISKQYFEETFSIDTARALQTWANDNLIEESVGDYAMLVAYESNGGGSGFAETELSGLTIDDSYTLRLYVYDLGVNMVRFKINSLPNDNSSMVQEIGYGLGWRELTFTATETTMYLAIGDEDPFVGSEIIVDNITVKNNVGTNFVTNSTFEGNDTTGWYGQTANAGISVYEYDATPVEPPIEPPITDNPYYISVAIPVYDAGNPKHCRVGDSVDADLPHEISTYANTAYDVYYIEPGLYTGQVSLHRNGSSANPLIITTLGLEVHPAKVLESEQARVAFSFTGDYWIMDKLSGNGWYTGQTTSGVFSFEVGASSNIINECYQLNGYPFVHFSKNCNDSTVQRCYCDGVATSMYSSDTAYIMFEEYESNGIGGMPSMNNHIILNDFRNFKAMKYTTIYEHLDYHDFQGNVWDSNNLWFDKEVWCDENGDQDDNGLYCFAEASWGGVKAAGLNPDNPMILSNNTLQGAKPTYPNAPSHLSSPSGSFATVYINARYVHQFGNVIANNAGGICMTFNLGSYGIEVYDSRMEKNIIYRNIMEPGYNTSSNSCVRMQRGANNTTRDNLIREGDGQWLRATDINTGSSSGVTGNYLGNNDVVDTDFTVNGWAYESVDGWDTNQELTTAQADAKYTYDYTITMGRYTNAPWTYIVPKVIEIPQDEFIQSIWNRV